MFSHISIGFFSVWSLCRWRRRRKRRAGGAVYLFIMQLFLCGTTQIRASDASEQPPNESDQQLRELCFNLTSSLILRYSFHRFHSYFLFSRLYCSSLLDASTSTTRSYDTPPSLPVITLNSYFARPHLNFHRPSTLQVLKGRQTPTLMTSLKWGFTNSYHSHVLINRPFDPAWRHPRRSQSSGSSPV